MLGQARRRCANARNARIHSTRRAFWPIIRAITRPPRALHEESLAIMRERRAIARASPSRSTASAMSRSIRATILRRGRSTRKASRSRASSPTGVASPRRSTISARRLRAARLCLGARVVRGEPRDHAGAGRPGRRRRPRCTTSASSPRHQGDCGGRQALHEESLTIVRELGDQEASPIAGDPGDVAHDHGDYPPRAALHQESLAIRRTLGERRDCLFARGAGGVRGPRQCRPRRPHLGRGGTVARGDRIAAATQRTVPIRAARRRRARGAGR